MGQLKDDVVKQISEGEAAYALREAWKKLYNDYPSVECLALLWAQWALETGRGKAIHCYNFGNIKRSGDEDYCMYRCNEVIGGKLQWFDPPHRQTHFRAYATAVDGAYDYISFLSKKTRYLKAWEQVKNGDSAAFSHELKVAGYYTADEAMYTKGVVSLTNEFKRKAPTLLEWRPVLAPPTPEPTKPEEPSVESIQEPIVPVVVDPVSAPSSEPVPPKKPANRMVALMQLLAELFKRFFA